MGTHEEAPRVWVVRAGRHGEDEDKALGNNVAIVRFVEFGDLARYASAEDLVAEFLAQNADAPRRRAESYARQLLTLRDKIAIGDVVVLPLKTRPGQIALGRVTGPYRHQDVGGEQRHTRPVEWERTDVPRSRFHQDLLHSFGAFSTVFRVQRNNAEARVQAVLAGRPDPGIPPGGMRRPAAEDGAEEVEAGLDLEQAAADEVSAFIRTRFQDHALARLVDAVLRAEGFNTQRSPAGPDGGADILAGRGPLGLDPPFLCVQVKATDAPVDVRVFRELAGTMAAFKASQGLLVSWGGFKDSVRREARQEAFKIRLWDQSDLVPAIYRVYEKLSPDVKAELPLKQVWVLVPDDGDAEE